MSCAGAAAVGGEGRENKVGASVSPCTVLTKLPIWQVLTWFLPRAPSRGTRDVSCLASGAVPQGWQLLFPLPAFLITRYVVHDSPSFQNMLFTRVLGSLSVLGLALAVQAADPPTELEIDRTFVPEDCTLTARGGDRLQVHYVSSECPLYSKIYLTERNCRLESCSPTATSLTRGNAFGACSGM